MDAAASLGVHVAMGHTDATFAEAQRAVGLGVRHAVHTFNAMRPFSHRDPGVIAATLLDERVAAELIADGVHVDAPAMRLLLKAKGPEGVLLVTDGVAPLGMPEGRYRLGQLDVEISGGAVRSLDGILAGSILTLDRALRNIRTCTSLPLGDLVRMATWNQAKLMGLTARKGAIVPGADADLVLLDRGLNVQRVFLRGKELT
jgi:N-acetylglucosamine-6-phosphate deacetylase